MGGVHVRNGPDPKRQRRRCIMGLIDWLFRKGRPKIQPQQDAKDSSYHWHMRTICAWPASLIPEADANGLHLSREDVANLPTMDDLFSLVRWRPHVQTQTGARPSRIITIPRLVRGEGSKQDKSCWSWLPPAVPVFPRNCHNQADIRSLWSRRAAISCFSHRLNGNPAMTGSRC